jgi:hypothetical protein
LSVLGQIPAQGGIRHYQYWYRDAYDFCTSATYNLSNTTRIIWTP